MTNYTYNPSRGVRDKEIQNMAKLIDLGKLDRSQVYQKSIAVIVISYFMKSK